MTQQTDSVTVLVVDSAGTQATYTVPILYLGVVAGTTYVRPTGMSPLGVPYIPIEGMGRGFGPGTDPNVIIAAMTTPGVLTFPYGTFPCRGFSKGDYTGIDIPHGASQGTRGVCVGLAGSGVGDLSGLAQGTYFTMVTGSATQTSDRLCLLKAGDPADLELCGFQVQGTEQGRAFSNFQVARARKACLIHHIFTTGHSGYANVPPGETTGFAILDMSDQTVMAHQISDIEADCRRADGKRYGAAPLGGQNCNGSTWTRVYGHHAVASSVGWSASRNVTTYNLRSEYNGTGAGGAHLSGAGINHENTTGFHHVNPGLIVDHSNGNNGVHIAHANYNGNGHNASEYGAGTLTIDNPVANEFTPDGTFGAGQFYMQATAATLQMGNTSQPVINGQAKTPAGKVLTPVWIHG